MVKQFEVYLINLDPTAGSEIKKTRPCLIISPTVLTSEIEPIKIIKATAKR